MDREIVVQTTCPATRIPSGEAVELEALRSFGLVQALGGSVTLRDSSGLYRVAREHLGALGPEIEAEIRAGAQAETSQPAGDFSEEQVWDALRQCFDPEIPLNIVDLGLIYDLQATEVQGGAYDVDVRMTLTATGCGMGPTIAADARERIEALPSVRQAEVEIVWDPQWTPHMISPEGRKILGLD